MCVANLVLTNQSQPEATSSKNEDKNIPLGVGALFVSILALASIPPLTGAEGFVFLVLSFPFVTSFGMTTAVCTSLYLQCLQP